MSIESKHAYRFGFLKSEEWEIVRTEALARDDAKCRLCESRSLTNDVHHLMYRIRWKNTDVDDLLTLCRDCHQLIHLLLKPRKEKRSESVELTLAGAMEEFEFAKDLMDRMAIILKKNCKGIPPKLKLTEEEKKILKSGCAWCLNRGPLDTVILNKFFPGKLHGANWKVDLCGNCSKSFPQSFESVGKMRAFWLQGFKSKEILIKNLLTEIDNGNKSPLSRLATCETAGVKSGL